jgi:hypothetical protein
VTVRSRTVATAALTKLDDSALLPVIGMAVNLTPGLSLSHRRRLRPRVIVEIGRRAAHGIWQKAPCRLAKLKLPDGRAVSDNIRTRVQIASARTLAVNLKMRHSAKSYPDKRATRLRGQTRLPWLAGQPTLYKVSFQSLGSRPSTS